MDTRYQVQHIPKVTIKEIESNSLLHMHPNTYTLQREKHSLLHETIFPLHEVKICACKGMHV